MTAVLLTRSRPRPWVIRVAVAVMILFTLFLIACGVIALAGLVLLVVSFS